MKIVILTFAFWASICNGQTSLVDTVKNELQVETKNTSSKTPIATVEAPYKSDAKARVRSTFVLIGVSRANSFSNVAHPDLQQSTEQNKLKSWPEVSLQVVHNFRPKSQEQIFGFGYGLGGELAYARATQDMNKGNLYDQVRLQNFRWGFGPFVSVEFNTSIIKIFSYFGQESQAAVSGSKRISSFQKSGSKTYGLNWAYFFNSNIGLFAEVMRVSKFNSQVRLGLVLSQL